MNNFEGGYLSDNDDMLLDTGADIGIAIDPHEQMSLVAIDSEMLTEYLGGHAEAVSVGSGIIFWFSATGSWKTVNRMATLNLLAASGELPRNVPLLWGPVLVTGSTASGSPRGLTDTQIDVLADGPQPTWLEQLVLSIRQRRAERRRRISTS